MKKKITITLLSLLFLGAVLSGLHFLSSHDIVVLNPKGLIAMKQRDLIIIASLLMLIVVIPVFILTWLFAYKYRAGSKAKYTPDWHHSYIAETLWWSVPFLIIVVLAAITWKSSHELSPFKPIDAGKKQLEIQAVALDWKWLFIYPEQGIATINFIQFPEKMPLSFEITADAPMNSFWIPQLGGQIYAMPAMKTKLHLIANEIGSFRGSSANLSGKGFAGMVFTAESTSQEDFDRWVKSVKQSSRSLTFDEYHRLALPSEYHPVTTYVLAEENLFDHIVMKYGMPGH